MKKTISILMALVLALSMCAVTAFAASPATLTVKSSAAQAKVGDVITVTVDLGANSGLASLKFLVQYDSASVEPVGLPAGNPNADADAPENRERAKFGVVTGLFTSTMANWNEKGGVSVTGVCVSDPVTASGKMFEVQFKVLKTNPTFGIVVMEAFGDNDNAVTVTGNSVTVACAHANKTSTVTKEPTCTETGTQSSVCAECGATLSNETIPAKGHSFGEWEVTKEATCEEAGEKVQKCTVCGEVLATEVIPAKGHSLEDAEITKKPTCTEEGERVGVCSVCGKEVTEAIPALGHDVTEWTIDKDATCTEDGLKHGICNRCEEEVSEVIPAKGHAFGEWTVVKEATETEEGLKERVCSVCGEKETEVIPKLGAADADPITQPSIPKTSGAVVGSVAALAMLSMAAGVAAVTLKKKKDEEEK